jgi:hypothetical protein
VISLVFIICSSVPYLLTVNSSIRPIFFIINHSRERVAFTFHYVYNAERELLIEGISNSDREVHNDKLW